MERCDVTARCARVRASDASSKGARRLTDAARIANECRLPSPPFGVGTGEIYIRPYPGLDHVWTVSAGGGVQARWNPSGKEIFYRNGSKMVGVSIDASGNEPIRQKPVVLFEGVGFGLSVATPN